MGISSRFIRKFLASKPLVFGVWIAAFLPWVFWWGIHTNIGQKWLQAQADTYFQSMYPKASLVWQGLRLNPSVDLQIDSLELYSHSNRKLLSIKDLHLEWGLRKGIHLVVEQVYTEIDGTHWSDFTSQESTESSSIFSWSNPIQLLVPYSIQIPQIVLAQEGVKQGTVLFFMDGAISNSIQVADLYLGAQWSDYPLLELQSIASYEGTKLDIERINLSTQGGDFSLKGFLDFSTTKIETSGRIRIQKNGTQAWVEDLQLPSNNVSMQYNIAGDMSSLSVQGVLSAIGEVKVALDILPLEESWTVSLSPKDFDISALAPTMIEATVLNGLYRIEGQGFANDTLHANIDIKGEEEILWGEKIQKWNTSTSYENSAFDITTLDIDHSLGTIHTKGRLDLNEQKGDLDVNLGIDHMEDLGSYNIRARGKIGYNGSLSFLWGDHVAATVYGELTGDQLAYEDYFLQELASTVNVDYQSGIVSGEISLEAEGFDGAGITIREIRAQQQITADETEVVAGDIALLGVNVPDVMSLDDFLGEISIDGMQDIVFEGKLGSMTLFEKGVQYNRGDVSVRLQEQDFLASLSIFEQDESIVKLEVDGNFETGRIGLDTLYFHPTRDVEWKQEKRSSIQISEGSIQQASIHLVSKTGEIHFEQHRDRVSLGLLGLDINRLQILVEHIMGEPLIESAVKGQIFADIQWNQKQVEGSLDLSGLYFADYAKDIGLQTKIKGAWDHPSLEITMEGKKSLISLSASVPFTEDFQIDCSRFGTLYVQIPAQNIIESQEFLPILPKDDISIGGVMTMEESFCDPSIDLAVNSVVPLGHEKIVIEGKMKRVQKTLDIHTYVMRNYAPKVTLIGQVQGQYALFFQNLIMSGTVLSVEELIEDMDLRLQSIDFSVARLLKLMDIHGDIQGMLHASLAIGGNPTQPEVNGRFWLEEAFFGGVELQSPEMTIRTEQDYFFDGTVAFENGFATMVGVLPQDLDSVSLSIQSDSVPLRSILGVVPDTTQVQGTLAVNGSIDGPFDNLQHSLHLVVDNGRFSYVPLNISISELQIDTSLESDQVVISSCTMNNSSLRNKEKGSAVLRGTLLKEGMKLRSGSLQLNLNKFWFMDRSDQSYRFTGDLLAKYLPKGVFDLSGSVLLNQGKILLDSGFFSDESTLSISPKIKVFRPEVEFERTVDVEESTSSIEISNIDVDLNQQLYLTAEFPLLDDYNKQLAVLSTAYVDGIFDGEVKLSMDEESLSMEGQVYALRGDLKAMGAMFAISNANLSFLGRDYYNPIMDIQAMRTIDNYEVVTSLSGSVAVPQLSFSSTSSESLSQTDIISLILFGRVASELGDNNPLLSSVMTSLSGSMNQLMGASLVDRFSWDPSSQQIEIGMSLSEKLYLSITQVYQGQNQDIQSQTIIGLEFFILKRMYMEMQSNPSTGSLSGYVFHRWRY